MTEPTLNAVDQAALDALLEADFELERVSPEIRERAGKLAKLLGLLDVTASERGPAADEANKQTLIDVTMARVSRSGAVAAEPTLNWHDEEALEAWLMGSGVGASDARAPRVAKHEALASLVTRTGLAEAQAGRETTIGRTFDACMAGGVQTYKIERFRGLRVRMADAMSVAAVLAIGAAMLWPMMSGLRDQSRRYACADNLRDVAGGMGLYAGANHDSLPVITAGLGGGKWWEVGSPDGRSNSSNLFHLAKLGFTKLTKLACPGNPSACTSLPDATAKDWRNLDEVSYSYRIMLGPKHPQWNESRVVILTDRSPVVLRAVRGEAINPWENSPNHNGRGQKVMLSDGSVTWYRRPELDNGDNIWLPLPIEKAIGDVTGREVRLEGTEFPASASDAFVGP